MASRCDDPPGLNVELHSNGPITQNDANWFWMEIYHAYMVIFQQLPPIGMVIETKPEDKPIRAQVSGILMDRYGGFTIILKKLPFDEKKSYRIEYEEGYLSCIRYFDKCLHK